MSQADVLHPPGTRTDPGGTAGFEVGFFVIGAQKAGTTALHEWLSAQAGTALPAIKETHFLCHEEFWSRGLDWYGAQFNARGGELLGEADPEYLYHPETAARIRALWPRARIVIVLRNPVDRAFSQYQMSRARGLEELEFQEALEAEQARLADGDLSSTAHRHQSYLLRSRYVKHLESFLQQFPARYIRLVRFDDLFGERRSTTLTALSGFIGLPELPRLGVSPTRSNARWTPRSRHLMEFLYGESRLRKILGRLLPSQGLRLRVGTWLERINHRTVSRRDPMPPLSARWAQAFDDETRAVEQLTGWDLNDWYQGARP